MADNSLYCPLEGYSCGPVGFFNADHIDVGHDVRGLLLVYELPSRTNTYVIGADPTVGRTAWTPATATADDRSIDNAALEVIKLGRMQARQSIGADGKPQTQYVRLPDVQVAEYAAPVDPITFAAILNAVGKLYRGDSEDDGCLICHESYPGPGLAVTPELYGRFGYTNLFIQGYLDSPKPKRTIEYGFMTSYQSKQLLWMKTNRHMKLDGVRINSPWLLEELVDDSSERFMGTRRHNDYVSGPMHDDRSMALRLALWAGNAWTMDADHVEETRVQAIGASAPDHQRMLIGSADAKAADAERWQQILDGMGQ